MLDKAHFINEPAKWQLLIMSAAHEQVFQELDRLSDLLKVHKALLSWLASSLTITAKLVECGDLQLDGDEDEDETEDEEEDGAAVMTRMRS